MLENLLEIWEMWCLIPCSITVLTHRDEWDGKNNSQWQNRKGMTHKPFQEPSWTAYAEQKKGGGSHSKGILVLEWIGPCSKTAVTSKGK